ncbi:Plasmodium vivax Vir protein, putative [Plasmodium vivax]|nr:Plasmodium vivax Vir protein, putative [Plasmodium vivax]
MYEPNIEYYQGEYKDQIKVLLKTLTLYELYNTFENELKSIPDVETCNVRCGAKLTGYPKEGLDLLKLCKVICNIILEVIANNGIYRESPCSRSFIYLNIWLYERVDQITSSDSEINNFYEALNSIMKTKKSELKNCSIINFNQGKNGFKDMKYLYEFLHICHNIKDVISADLNEKNQLYCTYIKEFFKHYNSIERNCKYNGKDPIYCSLTGKYQSTFTKTDTLESINKKCNFYKIPCDGDSTVKDILPCLEIKENSFKNKLQSDYMKNIVSTLHTAILPLISILGILLIFYKFTPLGSYLRTRMRRKKNIKTNTHEEKYNNLEKISTIQENNTDNLRYNIMYQ